MSINKGFSITSASRYSLALYELAEESKSLAQIELNSSIFLDLIASNENFNNFIKDPTINNETKLNIIKKISVISKLDHLFLNFLNFLINEATTHLFLVLSPYTLKILKIK